MTYLQFFLWLTGTYSVYYLINVLWDWSRQHSPAEAAEVHELTFIEQHTSEKVLLAPVSVIPDPVIEPVSRGLGGVTMANIFELARKETINLTASVSF